MSTLAGRTAHRPSNLPLGLMLVIFGVYLLTMSGHTYSPDEETMLAASQSLIVDASWALPPSKALVEVTGADGQRYSQYGPGQSVGAVPWVLAGRILGGFFPKDQAGYVLRLLLAAYNALIAAGICGLAAAAGLLLGYSRRASLLTGAALAFATFLWPHSRTFFSEPLVALLLLSAFYLLLPGVRWVRKGRMAISAPVLSGVLFALAVATKVQYAVALPAFLVYLAIASFGERAFSSDNGQPAENTRNLRKIPLWLVGLVVGLGPLFLYNAAIFGGALTTGYGADLKGTFRTPLAEGAYGLLLSPGKGLLWYALPAALSLWGVIWFARKHRAETVFVIALAVSIVTFFGLYIFWPGDGSWGPRYLIPLLPFAMLPALEVIERAAARVPTGAIVAAVLCLGFLANLMGVLVNFDTYLNIVSDDAIRFYRPDASPIWGHSRLLAQRADEWLSRLSPDAGTVLLTGGFSYSEGDKAKNEPLPRWTTGRGTLRLSVGNRPLTVTLRLADHRPPPLPRAGVVILVGNNPVQPFIAPVEGEPAAQDYSVAVAQNSTVTIKSDTWNPSKLQKRGRDENIGVRLEKIAIENNGEVSQPDIAEALPAPPYYPQPRWYYDPGTHHLSDLWFTYLAETRMGRKAQVGLVLLVSLPALLLILLGARTLRTSVR